METAKLGDLPGPPISVLVLVFILLGAGGYYWLMTNSRSCENRKPTEISKPPTNEDARTKGKDKQKKLPTRSSQKIHKETVTQHDLYCCTLKGFTHEVTSVSINTSGTRMVVASSDSSIRVFTIDPSTTSFEKQTSMRGTVNSDYCTAVDLSVDDMHVFGATGERAVKIRICLVQASVANSSSCHKNKVARACLSTNR